MNIVVLSPNPSCHWCIILVFLVSCMYMETYWVGLGLHFPLTDGRGTGLLCLFGALHTFSCGIILKMLAGLGVGKNMLYWFQSILTSQIKKVVLEEYYWLLGHFCYGPQRDPSCSSWCLTSRRKYWVRSSGDLVCSDINMQMIFYFSITSETIRSV